MAESTKSPSPLTAAIALVGFSLSSFAPTAARASGGSSSGSSDNSTSGGSSEDSSQGTTSGTFEGTTSGTTSGTTTGTSGSAAVSTLGTTLGITVGGLIAGAIVWVVLATGDKDDQGERAPRKGRSRALLDAGLVGVRQDLAMAAGMLVRSPAALDQLELDVARGGGPGLDTLVRATGVPAPELAAAWKTSRESLGAPADDTAAARLVVDFVARIGPRLQLEPRQAANVVWKLLEERQRPTFPQDAPTHAWMARWLGLPEAVVVEATASAFAGLDGSQAAARSAITHDPGRFLDAIASAVEREHEAEVEARIARLVKPIEGLLPAWVLAPAGG